MRNVVIASKKLVPFSKLTGDSQIEVAEKTGLSFEKIKSISSTNLLVEFKLVAKETKRIESKTPEYDKLPEKAEIPTMTYAGVGSRETPIEVQKQMTELAKELEKEHSVKAKK